MASDTTAFSFFLLFLPLNKLNVFSGQPRDQFIDFGWAGNVIFIKFTTPKRLRTPLTSVGGLMHRIALTHDGTGR